MIGVKGIKFYTNRRFWFVLTNKRNCRFFDYIKFSFHHKFFSFFLVQRRSNLSPLVDGKRHSFLVTSFLRGTPGLISTLDVPKELALVDSAVGHSTTSWRATGISLASFTSVVSGSSRFDFWFKPTAASRSTKTDVPRIPVMVAAKINWTTLVFVYNLTLF